MENEQFQSIIDNGSVWLQERWAKVVTHVQNDAKRLYNTDLTPQEVMSLSEARIWALGNGDLDTERYQSEFESLPAFREQQAKKRIENGDLVETAKAVLSVLPLPRASRISEARRLGVADVKNESDGSGLSREATLALLMSMPPHQRLTMARRWHVL